MKKTAKAPEEKKKSAYVMKPKKPLSAWLIFNTKKVAELKETGIDHKTAFQKSAEAWKEMTEKAKKPFLDLAKKDEERHAKQLKELEDKGYFTMPDGTKSTEADVDVKKKWGKDVTLPKRATPAYMFYSMEKLKEIKEKFKIEKQGDAMKKCGELWSAMTEKERSKYVKKQEQDAERYKKQLAEL